MLEACPQLSGDLVTTEIRHADVEDYDIKLVTLGQDKRFDAAESSRANMPHEGEE